MSMNHSIIRPLNKFVVPECDNWIIDTDVGGDDAQALILMIDLAKKRNKKILGITCCNGNAQLKDVIKNTLITLAVSKTDIPIYPGSRESLIFTIQKDYFFGKDGFCELQAQYNEKYRWQIKTSLVQQQCAAMFISRAAREHKGNIGIVAIGPLTNLAVAHLYDPQVSENVEILSIMGGNYTAIGMNRQFSSEFNFTSDAQAAHIVLKTFKNIYLSTYDLVIDMNPKDYQEMFANTSTPKAKLVHDLYSFIKKSIQPTPCDPLAVLSVFAPQSIQSICQVRGQVAISGHRTNGYLALNWLENVDDLPVSKGIVRIITKYKPSKVNQLIGQSYK